MKRADATTVAIAITTTQNMRKQNSYSSVKFGQPPDIDRTLSTISFAKSLNNWYVHKVSRITEETSSDGFPPEWNGSGRRQSEFVRRNIKGAARGFLKKIRK